MFRRQDFSTMLSTKVFSRSLDQSSARGRKMEKKLKMERRLQKNNNKRSRESARSECSQN